MDPRKVVVSIVNSLDPLFPPAIMEVKYADMPIVCIVLFIRWQTMSSLGKHRTRSKELPPALRPSPLPEAHMKRLERVTNEDYGCFEAKFYLFPLLLSLGRGLRPGHWRRVRARGRARGGAEAGESFAVGDALRWRVQATSMQDLKTVVSEQVGFGATFLCQAWTSCRWTWTCFSSRTLALDVFCWFLRPGQRCHQSRLTGPNGQTPGCCL